VLTIEERVAFVEGRLVEQSALFSDIRTAISSLGGRLDHRCDQLDHRMGRLDQRIDRLDQRMDGLDQRMDGLDQRMDGLDQRMDRIEERMDRFADRMDRRFGQVDARLERVAGDQSMNFRWLVGIQVTTLVTVVAALLRTLTAP
jgi:chromosome segregation ATPase